MPHHRKIVPLHYSHLWHFVGIVLLTSIIYLSLTPKPPITLSFSMGDKLGHLLAYGILMGWYTQLYRGRMQLMLLAIAFALMGVLMEILQSVGGHRFFEYGDMLANTLGVAIGWWISGYLLAGLLLRLEKKAQQVLIK